MAETVTLEQVERLIEQLTPAQRLKLAARICEQLSAASDIQQGGDEIERLKQKRLKLVEGLLSEVNHIEDDSRGEFDAATDLRQLREERIKQLSLITCNYLANFQTV
jgi:hypothetical protein